MSEPDAALFQLRIARAALLRWLDLPVRPASTWTDWREIGGEYLAHYDPDHATAAIGEAALRRTIGDVDGDLATFDTYRDGVRWLLKTAEVPALGYARFDAELEFFTAGSLTFGEDLSSALLFLALVRGAVDVLGQRGAGIALLHNFIWATRRIG